MRRTAPLATVVAAAALAGCAGYSTDSLYRQDVRTVCVPIFASQEFRRNIEFDLSNELVRTIELRTPYKVVHDRARADTEIRGEVLNLDEQVFVEDLDTDQPVEAQVVLHAWFEWKDLRTGEVLVRRADMAAMGTFATAVGETLDSARGEATRRLAERIVEAMERDW